MYDEGIEEAEQVLKDEKKEKIGIGIASLYFGKREIVAERVQCTQRTSTQRSTSRQASFSGSPFRKAGSHI